jgi:hypothetical protein
MGTGMLPIIIRLLILILLDMVFEFENPLSFSLSPPLSSSLSLLPSPLSPPPLSPLLSPLPSPLSHPFAPANAASRRHKVLSWRSLWCRIMGGHQQSTILHFWRVWICWLSTRVLIIIIEIFNYIY